jgi:hypothetical protein
MVVVLTRLNKKVRTVKTTLSLLRHAVFLHKGTVHTVPAIQAILVNVDFIHFMYQVKLSFFKSDSYARRSYQRICGSHLS